jgi:hypothetical protein
MRTILCMLLLWQTCAPHCMPRPIGLPYFTSSLRWQTCASLCMPRPISLPFFNFSLLWQTCMPLCMPRQIGLPISLRVAPLTDMRTPLHAPSDLSAVLSLLWLWLVFTPFTCSCCWLTPFLILMRLWHCLCSALMAPALVPAMIQTCHDTNWKLVVAKKVFPKDFAMMILWCEYF